MKSRIVTVTLAVAMGLWVNAAVAQTEPPKDPFAPDPTFDDPQQSELPLGDLGPIVEESIAGQPAPDPSQVERDSEWLYTVRRWASGAPWSQIGLGVGALGALLLAGWGAMSLFRKRAKRAYRRMPRSSGGSRPQGLEAVVSSVQLGRTSRAGRPPPEDPLTGREWPR